MPLEIASLSLSKYRSCGVSNAISTVSGSAQKLFLVHFLQNFCVLSGISIIFGVSYLDDGIIFKDHLNAPRNGQSQPVEISQSWCVKCSQYGIRFCPEICTCPYFTKRLFYRESVSPLMCHISIMV